ncbi:acetyltransferase, GNAT family [Phenylobacterium zucineum HLK1]|uniref:Acetyltransferase, GNAT family n=1 Tax=Phenylobacterium zucineum (strain HLK1) TaxID=450851 RepID=B4RH65_PHEZH|nr:N-acetyltransferase [Phenylobacterium zucineum]ACG79013.1 acetyltransferase, GNAT family [Phenylobacterium zucineum HLK1]
MIRHARPSDHGAVRQLVADAFQGETEARLVDLLRADGDVLFELVSLNGETVEGHILFSRMWADRQGLYAALGPLAVRPDRQRTGIGSALVRAALETAREFGVEGVILLGHPAYYPRFGFSTQAARQVRSPYAGNPAFMALALEPGAFDAPLSVAYPDAFAG